MHITDFKYPEDADLYRYMDLTFANKNQDALII